MDAEQVRKLCEAAFPGYEVNLVQRRDTENAYDVELQRDVGDKEHTVILGLHLPDKALAASLAHPSQRVDWLRALALEVTGLGVPLVGHVM